MKRREREGRREGGGEGGGRVSEMRVPARFCVNSGRARFLILASPPLFFFPLFLPFFCLFFFFLWVGLMPGFANCMSASPHRDLLCPCVASLSSPRPVSLLSEAQLVVLGLVV